MVAVDIDVAAEVFGVSRLMDFRQTATSLPAQTNVVLSLDEDALTICTTCVTH